MVDQENTSKILTNFVQAMTEQAVLVIGDIMLDQFVYGDVDRISPESPVPVLKIKRETLMLGGAGNVVSNLRGLGVKPHIIAIVGEDDSGDRIRALLSEHNASDEMLLTHTDKPTTIKTRYLAGHQQLLRTDREDIVALDAAQEAQILDNVKTLIPNIGAIILSDYGKGLLTDKVIAAIINMAKGSNVPVLVDPKGTDYSRYSGATGVTPNKKELSEAANGMAVGTDEEVEITTNYLIEKSGIETVFATRSADGLTVAQRQKQAVHIPTKKIDVYDVSGAGDTVIAVIASTLAAGANVVQAGHIANIAGSIVVAKVGTAPVRQDELLLALSDEKAGNHNICNWNEAKDKMEQWQARGLKVGFTNGCFDILHYGHVSYLDDARTRCDRLVIGLNSDASVSRLKGPERPVNDEQARAHVIAALQSADMVVMFGDNPEDDDKPVNLVGYLKPDIYIKGGDYTIDQLPEAQVVQSYGGTVDIMPLYEGHSTTGTIKKMKKTG